MEESLKKSTIGLVRLEDFQNTRKALEEAKAREAARTDDLKYVWTPFTSTVVKRIWLTGSWRCF